MAKQKLDLKAAAMKVAGLGAGAVAASFVDTLPFVSTQDAKIRAGGKIALGVLIPMFAGKMPLLTSVGDGLIAAGAAQLAAEFMPGTAVTGMGYSTYVKGMGSAGGLGIKGTSDLE